MTRHEIWVEMVSLAAPPVGVVVMLLLLRVCA
jgi:hypothetical protein